MIDKDFAQIKEFYRLAFEKLDNTRAAPPLTVEFYPYIGLRQTIRIRNREVLVRLSDLTRPAPPQVHQALALILVAKILKKRVPQAAQNIYTEFVNQPEITAAAQANRRTRGRKMVTTPRGSAYDLNEAFERVNAKYFQNAMTKPVLTWSQTKTFRIFGHHDALHETIVISQTLDDKRVPAFVLEFVLFHELLHIKHPTQIVNGRRQIHSAAFRRDERRFPQFDEAENWLQKLARSKSR